MRKYDKIRKNYWDYDMEEYVNMLKAKDKKIIYLQNIILKSIKWIHHHISKYNCKGITIIDWDELSNPNDLLEILGEKENE